MLGRRHRILRALPPARALRSRKALSDWAHAQILGNATYRAGTVRAGARLNRWGVRLLVRSRRLMRFLNHHTSDEVSDRFTVGLGDLHAEIEDILRRQREEYPHYSYFYGEPYQALGILDVFGERATEERFDAYDLGALITRDDVILDVGCSCGFMAIYTAFRTGCRAHGIDVNPYMIEVGRACARHLGIEHLVTLEACRIQDFEPSERYTTIFSFATHWTDDENYRVALRDHLTRLHSWLSDGGQLILESHANDLGDPAFDEGIEDMSSHFEVVDRRFVDRATRELLVMHRLADGAPRRAKARLRSATSAELVVYAGSWVDELWVRSTIQAAAGRGIDVLVAVSDRPDAAPDGLHDAYDGHDVRFAAGADLAVLEALRGGALLSATTNIAELPFQRAWPKVHMPHSLASLHMIYPPDAFDGYDVLLACGPHHVEEFERLSRWRGLGARRSFEAGYGKLDVLRADPRAGQRATPVRDAPASVLLAPSSGEGNVLETIGAELCRALLRQGLVVTVRPHPLLCRPGNEVVGALLGEFGGDDRFRLESSRDGDGAIFSADVLISDYSGAAMEFAALGPRPIVFVDVPRKVLNPAWADVAGEPVEVALRPELGTVVAASPGAVAEAAAAGSLNTSAQEAALRKVLYDGAPCGERAAGVVADLLASP